MKKSLLMALVACVAIGVQAGEGDVDKKADGKAKPVTKKAFIANQKKMAEKKGVEFDQAAAKAEFKKLDKNNDGKLAADEAPQKKGKGKGKEEAAPTPQVETKKGTPKPVTQEMFVANQKKMAEKKGVEFDQAAAEAKFVKMDKNKDGKLTGDEVPKKKAKAKGKGEGKAKAPAEEATDSSDE